MLMNLKGRREGEKTGVQLARDSVGKEGGVMSSGPVQGLVRTG